jgi:inosine-uridine nucleoside N-ribohydrolase
LEGKPNIDGGRNALELNTPELRKRLKAHGLFKSIFAAALLLAGFAATRAACADTSPAGGSALSGTQQRGAPVNVIFDTDMWSDIDDALALAMLHALQDRHEINLLAVTVSTDIKWCASYVDLVDTFYGHPQVPIGLVRNGLNLEAFQEKFPNITWPVTRYTQILSEEKNSSGALIYPHRLLDGTKAPEAVSLLRKTLAGVPDASVVMIQVGYSTNLARLLNSAPDAASPYLGRDLIRQKVRLLSLMAGNFAATTSEDGKTLEKGRPETNLMIDVPSAQSLFSGWPTPIVASGFEIGLAMLYPAKSIERDFSYVEHHPIAETYRVYSAESTWKLKWPHDHPTFDLTSVLYATRPDRGYFSLSKPGRITVLANGGSRFDESEGGLHRYLILSDEQKPRALEAMVILVSQPPKPPHVHPPPKKNNSR